MQRYLTVLFVAVASVPAWAASQRNVIVIVADDLGKQLGCYGDKLAKTPNVDRLAAQGVRFNRAYCTTASCSASRSVLMSGLHNHATGHYGHAHGSGHFSTYESVRSLPVMLGDAGYRTCLIGKYHLAPEYTYKFETQRQEGTQGARNTVRMAQNAKAWIAENDQKPFFLYFCPTDPHRAGADSFANHPNQSDFYAGIQPTVYRPEEMNVPAWLPDKPEVRQELAEYYQSIARLDVGIGTLLDGLKETGHWEDTLVMFLSDNGPPFPGAKTTHYEPGTNLPLIVRDPRLKTQGGTNEALVTWVDVMPTVLDYCGVKPQGLGPVRMSENIGRTPVAGEGKKPNAAKESGELKPYKLHGRSFLSVLDQERPAGWDEAFSSHTFHEVTMYYPMRTVRSGKFKLIFNIANPLPYPFASDLFASPTWQAVLKRNDEYELYGQRSVKAYLHRPRFELFDLEADPHETKNLAEDPAHQTTFETLQAKLKKWQEATNDPWDTKWTYE